MDQTELSSIGDGIIADDLIVDELESDGRLSGTVVDAVIAGNATQAGIQVHSLQQAIDSFSAALNASAIAKSTGLPVRTPAAQYKGFAAEEYFKHTFMLDALSKGIPDWQVAAYTNGVMPDGTVLSRIDMETDIIGYSPTLPFSWQCESRLHP